VEFRACPSKGSCDSAQARSLPKRTGLKLVYIQGIYPNDAILQQAIEIVGPCEVHQEWLRDLWWLS